MKRSAQAHWSGDLKTGQGTLTTESGALSQLPYSFTTRFENTPGTNPEELIAAAVSGCFTMALSAFLNKAGYSPESLTTDCEVQLSAIQDGWEVDAISLNLKGTVPKITPSEFESIANDAKEKCPMSQLMKAPITLQAALV